MDEFELIRRYFLRQTKSPVVATGIGDDGAVLRPPAGRELVSVIDTMVAGIHFPKSMDAADIGYRVVAINLSDVAAMGATPQWMTLALTLPDARADWLERFADGLYEAAGECGVQLVGGDTTRGDELVVSVQMTDDVEPGMAIRRSGAQVGDAIWVTGTLGDAAAGLQQLSGESQDAFLVSRFARPTARVNAGAALSGLANSAIDISDGLVADLSKILEASGVGAEIDIDCLPISESLLQAVGREQAVRFAATGGDDYELCFTMLPDQDPPDLGCPVMRIGRITDGTTLLCRDQGVVVPYDDSGYRHFR